MEVFRVLSFAALAGLTFIPLERLFGRGGPRRGRLADLGFATLGELSVQLMVAVGLGWMLALVDLIGHTGPLWRSIDDRTMRQIVEVASGLLLFELMGYAYHRAAHRVPALWRLHKVHHSAQKMDWLASFRQHPLEIVALTLVQNVPLILLGIPLASHALVLLLLRLNTVFVHADLELPGRWWKQVVASPEFHHRHHQRDGRVVNYASLFPWLDRVFGTYSRERTGVVGLVERLPESFVGLVLAPIRSARRGDDVRSLSER